MRAAVLTEFGSPLQVRDLPRPEATPGDAVVRVEACGICRSDWHAWRGDAGGGVLAEMTAFGTLGFTVIDTW